MRKRSDFLGGPATSQLLRYSSLGLEMGIAVAIGLSLGWWLDSRFDTSPWLTILCLLFGIAAGFKNVLELIRKGFNDEQRDDDQP